MFLKYKGSIIFFKELQVILNGLALESLPFCEPFQIGDCETFTLEKRPVLWLKIGI
jgi:hypothetical protein